MDKGNKKEDFYLPSLWSYLHKEKKLTKRLEAYNQSLTPH